jgi:pentatricopeptide repeat protein
MEEFHSAATQQLQIAPSFQTYEVLLGGYASAGMEAKVMETFAEAASRSKITTRGCSLTVKGFLKNGMVDAALQQIHEMQKRSLPVPSFAVAQLFRSACEMGRAPAIFSQAKGIVVLPPEAVAQVLEDCVKRGDLKLALEVETQARQDKTSLLVSSYDSLLKICVMNAHVHALDLFEEMQSMGSRISEGLCVGLLARCAESKFLRFAEEIVRYVREHGGMSIAVYSALMKVYAYCDMYDKACDLYAQLKEQGLEPDSMMYGCLMKFAVECGRTELSEKLFSAAPQLDIQNYMSMIRAAGRDKDVDRAFVVLQKLKDSGAPLDSAAYNHVLDVCVSVGDLKRGCELMAEMKTVSKVDMITYNTMLKGHCSQGNTRAARELLLEMERSGLPPNDVSYNCLINASVSAGNFKDAWETIKMMEQKGVPVDHYTLSIMMKSSKKAKDPREICNVLSLLDRSNLNVCDDEVLLNTVLETCIRHRELNRLQNIMSLFYKSSLRPNVHTYGSLIKACSTLKQVHKCRELWQAMTEHRALQPNDIVLGCMLDALVCNECVEDALTLFNQWKATVPPNTVMYSTIIKGFANSRQSARAMDLWKEMKALKIEMNTVVYNSLIDSQARIGNIEEVSELIEGMRKSGCRPDAITCSTIVKGYCVRGDLDKAFEVFRNMQADNMAADSIVYNTVLDGCTRHNRMDLADLVLQDMDRLKIKPSNFTLGILVKMYGRRKQLDKAFQMLEQFPTKHGIQPNAQVKTCLMCACLSNNNLQKAYEVFEKIKSGGHGADAKTYSALLQGNVKRGNLVEAVRLIDEAYGLGQPRGLIPNQKLETGELEQLWRALAQRGMMEKIGVPLLERLRVAKIPVGRVPSVLSQ